MSPELISLADKTIACMLRLPPSPELSSLINRWQIPSVRPVVVDGKHIQTIEELHRDPIG